jgi:hypothetical protein
MINSCLFVLKAPLIDRNLLSEIEMVGYICAWAVNYAPKTQKAFLTGARKAS